MTELILKDKAYYFEVDSELPSIREDVLEKYYAYVICHCDVTLP